MGDSIIAMTDRQWKRLDPALADAYVYDVAAAYRVRGSTRCSPISIAVLTTTPDNVVIDLGTNDMGQSWAPWWSSRSETATRAAVADLSCVVYVTIRTQADFPVGADINAKIAATATANPKRAHLRLGDRSRRGARRRRSRYLAPAAVARRGASDCGGRRHPRRRCAPRARTPVHAPHRANSRRRRIAQFRPEVPRCWSVGARGGTRTPMPLRAADFESAVSADSTTRAALSRSCSRRIMPLGSILRHGPVRRRPRRGRFARDVAAILVAPSRRVRSERPLPGDVEAKILLGRDPDEATIPPVLGDPRARTVAERDRRAATSENPTLARAGVAATDGRAPFRAL